MEPLPIAEDEVDGSFIGDAKDLAKKAVSHVALNSLFAFVGSHPVKVATVAFDKLRNGDHLLVPRLMAKKSYIPECLHNTYRYFHHGIYVDDESGKYVVGFTAPKKIVDEQLTSETESHTADYDEVDGALSTDWLNPVKETALWGLMAVTNDIFIEPTTRNFRIVKEDIAAFTWPHSDLAHTGRFIRQHATLSQNGEEYPTAEPGHAARVARFFVQDEHHSRMFGTYSLPTWNCESFASFCSSTRLTTQQLECHLSTLEVDEERKKFLSEVSNTTENGMNRYLEHGLQTFFLYLETSSPESPVPPNTLGSRDSDYFSDCSSLHSIGKEVASLSRHTSEDSLSPRDSFAGGSKNLRAPRRGYRLSMQSNSSLESSYEA